MKYLVIVESPSKAKTIEKYLGKDYKVVSTVGHIIDLAKSKLSVDIESGEYEPEFHTIKGKAKVVKDIKKHIPKEGQIKIYLATDPDREGEAIAWHTANALKLEQPQRIVFNEITKTAVESAIKKPRKIDVDLVDAQIARRVLDRLVGYKVSELIWKKIWYGLSAGRVQSVALRLIVEREELRESFDPKEYWSVVADLQNSDNPQVLAELKRLDGDKYLPKDKKQVDTLIKDLKGKKFEVSEVKSRNVSKNPYPPFTTSTMQQAANNLFGFTAKRTMGVAQALYQAGYITYMRTDSVNLADQAIDAIRKSIKSQHGDEYLPAKPNLYKTKSKSAQEAHEAIRPTDIRVTKKQVSEDLDATAAKLYQLIKDRAVASQMANQESEVLTVIISAEGKSGKKYEFSLGAEKILFEGFRKLFGAKVGGDTQVVESINEGDEFDLNEFITEQHFTKPKPRYTDASLVKALEAKGIGRPSTYASIISTVQNRGYVIKEGRYLIPTDVGCVVTKFLKQNFERLVDYEYTANVEDELDKIATGDLEYAPFVDKEFKPLMGEIADADKAVDKEDVVILGESDEKCPKCDGEMVIRLGRYGKFLSCTKFPECKGMMSLDGGEDSLDYEKYKKPEKCPECGSGLVLKNGKYGQFWACETYPDCKGTVPMLLNEKCPECNSDLVERKGRWGKMFTGCSGYPDCKYIKKEKKKDE